MKVYVSEIRPLREKNWARDNSMFSLGILLKLLTTEEPIMAQFVSNLEKNTGRKRPTMAIRFAFLIENFFDKLSSQVFYRNSHTNPLFLLAFPHTELGEPVARAARSSAGTLIKWRIFIDSKLNPARNGYFLLNEFGGPIFYFKYFLRTMSSWSSKKITKNLLPVIWQFHKIVRKEPLRVEKPTLKLNLFSSVKFSQRY